MLAADHISAVKRSFESRAMPETEKPPARLVDIYYIGLAPFFFLCFYINCLTYFKMDPVKRTPEKNHPGG